jgi:hypothetical protein
MRLEQNFPGCGFCVRWLACEENDAVYQTNRVKPFAGKASSYRKCVWNKIFRAAAFVGAGLPAKKTARCIRQAA